MICSSLFKHVFHINKYFLGLYTQLVLVSIIKRHNSAWPLLLWQEVPTSNEKPPNSQQEWRNTKHLYLEKAFLELIEIWTLFPSIENFCSFHSQYSPCLLKSSRTVLLNLMLVHGIQLLAGLLLDAASSLAPFVKQIGLEPCLSGGLTLPVSIPAFVSIPPFFFFVWSNFAKEKIFIGFWKLKDDSCSEKNPVLFPTMIHLQCVVNYLQENWGC